ncbi:SDR family oxidoreductase [Streptacidiphilus sp. ASG 303]|uniref:SDR family NAD(P)-dependent oxidoreductase n=1 Tax=Streptacidiphilus sp. ASG 303 TaxID=2896847 RepID=UPI001E2B648C|nr:SDR family oxidoreductase [Streptacidiphilus sp. ASG 303]MCD0485150.1 SDR family oxidoreductase [Streptacidiphilus sp. ASG 303]
MGGLTDRVVLISGAAGGQGAATARRFVEEGARVVLGDVDERVGKVAEALGDAAAGVRLDVRDPESWAAAVACATGRWGRLDGLVNNAGVLHQAPLEATRPEDYLRVVEVNQLGVFLGMRAAVPALRAAGGGTVVNIASVNALQGVPLLTAYCASKHAVIGMTRVAALELGRDGIRVNAVCPGVVATEMTGGMPERIERRLLEEIPAGRFGRSEEVAALTLFLSGPDSSYCSGGVFVADGGWTAG